MSIRVTYVIANCLLLLIPAAVLWLFVFRFIPFCLRAQRAVKDDERAQAEFEESMMLKAMTLRERHDVLRAALETLVAMHHRTTEAVGNWDCALDQAEKALALAKAPLLPEKRPR